MHNSFTRGLALAAALAATSAAFAAKPARVIDLGTPEGAIAAFRKVQCSTEDQRPTVYYWTGETFSRVPGEPDKLLFRFEGMNVRQCVTVADPARGKGFRMVSREILFYKDPATGKILDEWQNPVTGETVKVLHIANDPVNFRAPIFPVKADGKPYESDVQVMGDQWWGTTTVPLFYRNPLAGDFQDYVGGMYHAPLDEDARPRRPALLQRRRGEARWLRQPPCRLPRGDRSARPDVPRAASGRRPAPQRDQLDVLQEADGSRAEEVGARRRRRPRPGHRSVASGFFALHQ